jgi:hypothetical protein
LALYVLSYMIYERVGTSRFDFFEEISGNVSTGVRSASASMFPAGAIKTNRHPEDIYCYSVLY